MYSRHKRGRRRFSMAAAMYMIGHCFDSNHNLYTSHDQHSQTANNDNRSPLNQVIMIRIKGTICNCGFDLYYDMYCTTHELDRYLHRGDPQLSMITHDT